MKRIVFTLLLTTALAVPVAAHAETYETNRSGFDFPFFNFGGGNQTVTTTERLGQIDHSNLDRTLIQAVQQQLTDAGYYKAGVDGVWDTATEVALAGYQGSEGFMPTGQLDEETLTHMGLVLPAADQIASQSRPLANAGTDTVYVITSREVPVQRSSSTSRSAMNMDRSEIIEVQQVLANSGFYTAGVDGIWGPRSEEALRNYQMANGISATGRLDSQTVAELGVDVDSDVSRIEPAAGSGW